MGQGQLQSGLMLVAASVTLAILLAALFTYVLVNGHVGSPF